MNHEFETIRAEDKGDGLVLLTLNRPQVANAMNTQMGRDLLAFFDAVNADPLAYRCIVVTGAGDKAFCAGGDLKERQGMTDETWQAQHLLFERDDPRLYRLPGAGHRRDQRRRLCRRLRIGAVLRLPLRRRDGALCADRGDARDHAGRRRHAEPAARGRRAARQGDHPDRPPLHRQGSLRMGHGQPALRRPTGCSTRRWKPPAASPTTRRSRCARRSTRSITGCRWTSRSGMMFEIEAYNRMVPTEDRREGIASFNEKRKPRIQGAVDAPCSHAVIARSGAAKQSRRTMSAPRRAGRSGRLAMTDNRRKANGRRDRKPGNGPN